jgi:hypothetical protein
VNYGGAAASRPIVYQSQDQNLILEANPNGISMMKMKRLKEIAKNGYW